MTDNRAQKAIRDDRKSGKAKKIFPQTSRPPRKTYSEVLDCDLWIIPDGITPTSEQTPYYTTSEIKHLKGADPEAIRVVHKLKMAMDEAGMPGEVVAKMQKVGDRWIKVQ